MLNYFPVFMDLSSKEVLIVGGGNIALRRVRTLLQFNCNISIITPKISKELLDIVNENAVKLIKRRYLSDDVVGKTLVIAATSDRNVNKQIGIDAGALGILVSVADARKECSFIFPGIIIDEPIVIGVTASGENHKLAKEVTADIKEIFNKR
jgi:siroheme synthase, N-terminal domain